MKATGSFSKFVRGRWPMAMVGLAIATACFLAIRAWQSDDGLDQVRAALRRFDAQEAKTLLGRVGDGRAPRASVAYLSAIAQRQQGDIAAAMESLRAARRFGWDRLEVEQQEKLLAFQSGDVDAAGPYLLEWLSKGASDDQAAEIYDCMVKGYLAAVRLNEAAYCVDSWIRWKPDDVRPLWLRAEVERTKRDYQHETVTYREILSRNPRDAQAHRELGRVLVENNDAQAAIEHLKYYHRDHPEDLETLVFLIRCHRSLGAPRQARVLLNDALQRIRTPRLRAEALVELGQLQLQEDSAEQAVATLRTATELASANSAAHYALALALARVGEKDESDRHLAESDRIAAQNERLADLANEIVRRPKDASLRCEAGQIMLDQGYYDEAKIWLLSALHCDAGHAATRKALARYDELTSAGNDSLPATALRPKP